MSEKISVKKRIVLISNALRVKKDGKGYNYDYFRPDDIMLALNPLLQEHNLICIFTMNESKNDDRYNGKLIVEDCDSNEKVKYNFPIPLTDIKGASAGQRMGATFTYCKRYSLMNVFNIANDEDDLDNPAKPKGKVQEKPTEAKMTVAGIIKKINESKTKDDIVKWKGWLEKSAGFTSPQKTIIERAIEEREKNL